MKEDKEPKLAHVSIRFSEFEQKRLAARIDPAKKIRSQIKELIFKGVSTRPPAEDESSAKGMAQLITLFQERTDKMTSLLGMLVSRIESLEEQLSAIGKDAARSKVVVENIQDYLHEDSQGG